MIHLNEIKKLRTDLYEGMRYVDAKVIDELLAELELEHNRLVGEIIKEQNYCDNQKLHAENQRLREALRRLIDTTNNYRPEVVGVCMMNALEDAESTLKQI